MNATMNQKEITKELNELLELEYDAIAAYQAAIERLDTLAYKEKLAEFLSDHRRHTQDLTQLIQNEGGSAEESGDAKKILTKGKVVLAEMAGDEAILKAMRSNEEQTNSAYDKALEMDFPSHVRSVIQNGLTDERRHKSWVEATLEAL